MSDTEYVNAVRINEEILQSERRERWNSNSQRLLKEIKHRSNNKKCQDANYYIRNQEVKLDTERRRYENNKECMKQKAKERYELNKEKRKQQMREYRSRCKAGGLPQRRSYDDNGDCLSYTAKGVALVFMYPVTDEEFKMPEASWHAHARNRAFEAKQQSRDQASAN